MPVRVSTVGIDLPDDFPHQPYEAIHARVHAAAHHPDQVFHYGGAWNAVVYRFLSCAEADVTFTQSVRTVGTSPGQPARFRQEEVLLNFFVNGLSEIESFFYGLYWIGSMAEPAHFPILPDNQLRNITTDKTMMLFGNGPHAALFAAAFSRLRTPSTPGNWVNTLEYDEWKDIRNILAHRASYGRVMHATTGGGPQPADEWRVRGIPLNDQVTQTRRAWLAATMKALLKSGEAYAVATL